MAADAAAACSAALKMEERLEQLHRSWLKRGLPAPKVRTGIYTGEMVAGTVGGQERLEYTVIGDSVNVASRLESFDKDFAHPRLGDRLVRTLIGEPTRELLDERFEPVEVGNLSLKGKSKTIAVYLLCRPVEKPAMEEIESKLEEVAP
jgi:adenylate cyclase